jgi:hypothetical protein
MRLIPYTLQLFRCMAGCATRGFANGGLGVEVRSAFVDMNALAASVRVRVEGERATGTVPAGQGSSLGQQARRSR